MRIAARRPAVRARYPLIFLGFPTSSRPVPPYPAFLSYLVCSQRLARFLSRAVNPYCFCVGGVGVKIEFSEDGPSLQDKLAGLLVRQKSGL